MKIKVIVNPRSGRRLVQKNLETIMGRLLLEGLAERIDFCATTERGDAYAAARALAPGEYDLLIGCGGDGTINEIINGLMSSGSKIPLAIIAAGTSNDFAYSLRLPADPEGFCAMVRNGLYRDIDIGCANGSYFINVASFGMFTDVAHTTDQDTKGVLGKLAYYIKGVSTAPEQLMRSIELQVSSEEQQLSGSFHLCLIANSMSVGSIRRLMYKADASDGLFDVLLLRSRPRPQTVADLMRRMLAVEGERDGAAVYFQTKHIEIRSADNAYVELDLDGELRGALPLTVDVCPAAVKLLIPDQQSEARLPIPFLDRAREELNDDDPAER